MFSLEKLIFIFSSLILLSCAAFFYFFFYPSNNLDYYFEFIKAQENPDSKVSVTDEEINELIFCKEKTAKKYNLMGDINDCLKSFYEKYTLQNGTNKAFSHLHQLEKKYPTFVNNCHYIAHGIGHSQLHLSGGDVGEAFAVMGYESYINNVATCGNGYYHGVIEEYSLNENNKERLIKKLKPVCEIMESLSKENPKYRQSDCYHGVGHAAFIQLEYRIDEALSVCDQITDKENMRYECYSGVFMQSLDDIPGADLIKVENGLAKFLICDVLDKKYQVACYNQHSSLFLGYTNEINNFPKNINFCKQINDDLNRMSCVNFFAAWSFTNRSTKIKEMCVGGTASSAERIACVSLVALRTARSLDITRQKEIYFQTVKDICKNLTWYEQRKCNDLVLNNPAVLYIPSTETLKI